MESKKPLLLFTHIHHMLIGPKLRLQQITNPDI